MEKTKLTTWQAACIITGYGVGSGIMALPYLVERTGILAAFAILIAFLVPLAFRKCRRENGKLLLPDAMAGTSMQIVVFVAFLLMAIGSVVSI